MAQEPRRPIKLGLAEAADNLGITAEALRRKFHAKGIAADRKAKYGLRQLVEAIGTNGEHAQAKIELENYRVQLARAELAEKQGELFSGELLETILRGVKDRILSWDRTDQEKEASLDDLRQYLKKNSRPKRNISIA